MAIPAYGNAAYLPETLDSVFAQTRPPAEVIVINDGSPDDTAGAVARFRDRIRYVEQENRGLVATENRALELYTGDYLLILGGDDCLRPDALADLAGVLDADPTIGLAHADVTTIDARGRPIPWDPYPFPRGKHRDVVGLLQQNYVPAPTALCRRGALDQAGPYTNHVYCQDWAMWIRMVLLGWAIYGVDRPLGLRRRHAGNLTRPALVVPRLEDAIAMLHDEERRAGARLRPATRAAFHDSRQVLRRKLAWQYLESGQARAARRLFARLALHNRDPRALAGCVATLVPLTVLQRLRRAGPLGPFKHALY